MKTIRETFHFFEICRIPKELGQKLSRCTLWPGGPTMWPGVYVLPPIYSSGHRAFDGKPVAEQLICALQANLGAQRLLKLKLMIADGNSVNHVARNDCKDLLKRIYSIV